MYLASMYLPVLGMSLLTGVFWSVFPLYTFSATHTRTRKKCNFEVSIKNACETDI